MILSILIVAVASGVGTRVLVAVGGAVGVSVGVLLGVAVAVGVGGTGVSVGVGVAVGVAVAVAVGVAVGAFYPIAFEYFNKLPKGVSLVSGTVSAHNITDNTDATATVLQSTTATISGTQALVKIRAGTTGKRYQITLRVTCSNSYVLEDELYMIVREL